MKILLLEDDYSYRISIKEYLESLDFEMEDFEDEQDAQDTIFENRYVPYKLDSFMYSTISYIWNTKY